MFNSSSCDDPSWGVDPTFTVVRTSWFVAAFSLDLLLTWKEFVQIQFWLNRI